MAEAENQTKNRQKDFQMEHMMKPDGQMVTLDGPLMDTGNGHLMEPDGHMVTNDGLWK